MKILRITLLFCITGMLITGCERSELEQQGIEQFTDNSEFKVMTPVYYREAQDANAIQVRFYESPRIFEVNRSSATFNTIKSLLDDNIKNKTPLRIYFNDETSPFIPIMAIQQASAAEIQQVANAKIILPPPGTIKTVIPNVRVLNTIFNYCKAQGCTTGTSEIDYCIPFQYVVDGCYARAHKMRQIMENDYGYTCEKVFSYEGATGYLAVDAGDCCVYWWYHVAPLVTVNTLNGIKKFVIDPSMFNQPVSVEEWTSAQENFDCTPYAEFGFSDITRGYIYAPGGSTDDYYYSTNQTLQYYADLVTCL